MNHSKNQPPAIVVSNTGPLLVLAKLRLLHLLPTLYKRVYFTQSVYDEAVAEGLRYGYKDAHTLQIFLSQSHWQPDEIDPEAKPESLDEALLDTGERDTLILAIKKQADLVLIDETIGRQVARNYGLTVKGTLGILLEAYDCNVIKADELRLYFAEIAQRTDIWISPTLCQRLLEKALQK